MTVTSGRLRGDDERRAAGCSTASDAGAGRTGQGPAARCFPREAGSALLGRPDRRRRFCQPVRPRAAQSRPRIHSSTVRDRDGASRRAQSGGERALARVRYAGREARPTRAAHLGLGHHSGGHRSSFLPSVAWSWLKPRTSTLVVTATENDPASQALARDVSARLASFQPIHFSALRLVGSQRVASRPDLILQVGHMVGDGHAGANLVLTTGSGRAIPWSRDVEQHSASPVDLRQQVAVAAALLLDCADEAMASPIG